MSPNDAPIILSDDALILPDRPTLAAVEQAANRAAASGVFADYRSRKAVNTLRRQDADLAVLVTFLGVVGVQVDPVALALDAESWRGITHGLLAAFVQWQLQQGYAVNTINVRLSTVKTYAQLAFKAGVLEAADHALIRTVNGYTLKEGKRVDEKRRDAGANTRYVRPGSKKAEAVSLTRKDAAALKDQPDTPQGRRDALLMALLLDHGLRCGEIARLTVGNVDLQAGLLHFYRPKVDKVQTHRLTSDTLKATRAYFKAGDAPLAAAAPLLRESVKGGALTEAGITERGITKRVKVLGEQAGISGLSAHDCRHYWATVAARSGTSPFALQEAGGWNSLAMPRRYVEAAQIANEGVKLEE
jgi:integrase